MNRELPDFLLVCATDKEMRAAVSLLPGADGLDPGAAVPGVRRGEGSFPDLPRLTLPGARLHLLVCGVGPVASALSLARLLGASGARGMAWRGVLNLGLAGTYDGKAAPVGALLLAEEEIFPEYGVWPEAHECLPPERGGGAGAAGAPRPMTLPQTVTDLGPVYGRLALDPDSALGNMGLSCHTGASCPPLCRGVCLTVAGVSGTPGRAGRFAGLFGGLAENMEGFSLALACRLSGLPFAELRALSNEAGRRPPDTWDMPGSLSSLARGGRMLFSPFF